MIPSALPGLGKHSGTEEKHLNNTFQSETLKIEIMPLLQDPDISQICFFE